MKLLYSQTCIRRPLLEPFKSGRLGQVVVLKNTFLKGPQTKSGCSRQVFSFYSHCECSINKDLLEQRFTILCNLVPFLKIPILILVNLVLKIPIWRSVVMQMLFMNGCKISNQMFFNMFSFSETRCILVMT